MGVSSKGENVWCFAIVTTFKGIGRAKRRGGRDVLKSSYGDDC